MKTLRKYVIAFFTAIALVCCAVAFAACNENKLTGISIENPQTMFMIGDEFSYGEDFKVYANYSDGTRVDITQDEELSIRKESVLDMNVAGDYQITVSYHKKVEAYTIYVSDFQPILRKIEADLTNVKKTYELGETVSLEGLKLTLTHENAQGNNVTSVVTSLRGFDVSISNAQGTTIREGDAFPALGDFTVTISKDDIKTSFTLSVNGVNLSGVESAIFVGTASRGEVVSGALSIKEARKDGKVFDAFHKDYTFGNNYLYMKETVEASEETYYSVDDEGMFSVKKQNGQIVTSETVSENAIEGAPVFLWYMSATEYGIENALENLYGHAKQCTNRDLKLSANEQTREYSFSFSGLELRSNAYDYYETAVSFKLGEKYNVESATITQLYYENNKIFVDEMGGIPTFITDETTGITTPTGTYSLMEIITVNQVAGERTATNPYSRDMFLVSSYDLVFDGKTLPNDSVIECDVTTPNLSFQIRNILPDTADFSQDLIYLDYEGSNGQTNSTLISCNGFVAFRKGNTISVTLRNGGVWKLILTTSKTRKTITFDVTGAPPASMTAQILDASSGLFRNASAKNVAVNGTVVFYGLVNQYANAAQTAEIISGDKNSATVTPITQNGTKCFGFSATASGVYTVKVTSTAAPDVSVTFTFTVSDMPDFETLLRGKYAAENFEGRYELSFAPGNQGGEVKGTLTVTLTPFGDDSEFDETKKQNGVYEYSVNADEQSIKLTSVDGKNFGIDLVVESGVFKLEDRKGQKTPLTASTAI